MFETPKSLPSVNLELLDRPATAMWIMMEVYQYNFVTLVSWAAMALVLCCFLWGSLHHLLAKDAPDLSALEIGEGTAMEHAKLLKQRAEDGLRLMLHLSCEREWLVFAGVVASLYFISVMAAHVDFLTTCYIGILVGMTMSALYVKEERKIKELAEKTRMKSQRLYSMMEEKLHNLKNRIAGKKKEKKQE